MDTREQILESAKRLVQQRGFNGFSYADVAGEVGIRKASLHHHFPAKTDLGLALIEAYSADSEVMLGRISKEQRTADAKLQAYVALYRLAFDADCMCLCGILASEALTLDAALRPRIERFFTRHTEWLAEVLAEGKSQGIFAYEGSAADHARVFLSSLQGALLIARASEDGDAFDRTGALLMASLLKNGLAKPR
ncbi:MAG: TetR/AcrR family transcriptional regulator [Hyphomicrobium sp.]